MPTRDYYEVLGVAARRLGRRDQAGLSRARARTSSRRRATTSRRPSIASRRSTKRTKCFPTRTSARSTIASARSATALRAVRTSASEPAASATSSTCSSASARGAAQARRAGTAARLRLALRHRNLARRGVCRNHERDRHSIGTGAMRSVQGQRRQARNDGRSVRSLRRHAAWLRTARQTPLGQMVTQIGVSSNAAARVTSSSSRARRARDAGAARSETPPDR